MSPSRACWVSSAFKVLVISTFDSIALLSSLFRLSESYNKSESRGLCPNTHSSTAVISVSYNDDEQRRDAGTVWPARRRVNKSYANYRNSNRRNPVRWCSMGHG